MSGERGLIMIGLRGMGGIDVGPLAQAQFSGQLDPSFLPTQYFKAGYSVDPQALPSDLYATDSFAQQIASLLGGSVVQAAPPGNYQGSGIPPANWVSADGEMILPGNLFPPGVILSYPDECSAERSLVASIPGGQLSAACAAGGPGMTPTQLAVSQGATIPVIPGTSTSTIIGYNPPAPVAHSIPTPVLPSSPVSVASPASPQTNGSQVFAGANPTPPVNAPAAGATDTTNLAGCFNPLSQWIGADTCIGPLGIVEWAVLAAGAFFMFSKGGR